MGTQRELDLGLEVDVTAETDLLNEPGFFDKGFDNQERIPDRYSVPEVEEMITEVVDILAEARPLPMSATVKVNRDELLEILEQVQDKLPEELRAARWLLKERDDFVAKAQQEHADLIAEGRKQVVRMVEREQIVDAAEIRAREILDKATDEANLMKRQTEEFCSSRLQAIESVLEKTLSTMQRGREKLLYPEEQGSAAIPEGYTPEMPDGSDEGAALASVERIDLRAVQRRMFK